MFIQKKFTEQLTVCNKQDKERSIASSRLLTTCLMFTKWELLFIDPGVKLNGQHY